MILDEFALEYSKQSTLNNSHLNYSVNELYSYIMEQKGKVDDSFWMMYFDALRFIGDNDSFQKFDKAVNSYMKVKNALPPKWEEDFKDNRPSLTTNVMRVGDLSKVNFAKVEDFIETTKSGSKVSRLDFSVTEFDQNKDYKEQLEWFSHLFLNIQGRSCSIIGSNNLVDFLEQRSKEPNAQPYANLLLLLLQCLGEKERYLSLASWYVDIFEETAREYKDSNVLKQPDIKEAQQDDEFCFRKNVELSDVVVFTEFLKNRLNNGDELIKINCEFCQHIEYNALQDLIKVFIENKEVLMNKTIVIDNLHQIVKYMLESMGIDKSMVTLKLVKYC